MRECKTEGCTNRTNKDYCGTCYYQAYLSDTWEYYHYQLQYRISKSESHDTDITLKDFKRLYKNDIEKAKSRKYRIVKKDKSKPFDKSNAKLHISKLLNK